jgi:hypothetical protein
MVSMCQKLVSAEFRVAALGSTVESAFVALTARATMAAQLHEIVLGGVAASLIGQRGQLSI